jgi:hypothetical protein
MLPCFAADPRASWQPAEGTNVYWHGRASRAELHASLDAAGVMLASPDQAAITVRAHVSSVHPRSPPPRAPRRFGRCLGVSWVSGVQAWLSGCAAPGWRRRGGGAPSATRA